MKLFSHVIDPLFDTPDGFEFEEAILRFQKILRAASPSRREQLATALLYHLRTKLEPLAERYGLNNSDTAKLSKELLDNHAPELTTAERRAAELGLVMVTDLHIQNFGERLFRLDSHDGKLFVFDPERVDHDLSQLKVIQRICAYMAFCLRASAFAHIANTFQRVSLQRVSNELGYPLPDKPAPMIDMALLESWAKREGRELSEQARNLIKIHHFLAEISLTGNILPWEDL